MDGKIIVSLVILDRGFSHLLPQTLQSIQMQTLTSYEVVRAKGSWKELLPQLRGQYVQFLLMGDRFLTPDALLDLSRQASSSQIAFLYLKQDRTVGYPDDAIAKRHCPISCVWFDRQFLLEQKVAGDDLYRVVLKVFCQNFRSTKTICRRALLSSPTFYGLACDSRKDLVLRLWMRIKSIF